MCVFVFLFNEKINVHKQFFSKKFFLDSFLMKGQKQLWMWFSIIIFATCQSRSVGFGQ